MAAQPGPRREYPGIQTRMRATSSILTAAVGAVLAGCDGHVLPLADAPVDTVPPGVFVEFIRSPDFSAEMLAFAVSGPSGSAELINPIDTVYGGDLLTRLRAGDSVELRVSVIWPNATSGRDTLAVYTTGLRSRASWDHYLVVALLGHWPGDFFCAQRPSLAYPFTVPGNAVADTMYVVSLTMPRPPPPC